jgi:hypothetical protein
MCHFSIKKPKLNLKIKNSKFYFLFFWKGRNWVLGVAALGKGGWPVSYLPHLNNVKKKYKNKKP